MTSESDEAGLCTATTGLLAPSGPFGFGSIGLFTIFGLGASIAMIRRGRTSTARLS